MYALSTDEKYIQRWAPNGVFFVSNHGHDHMDLLGIVICKQRESADLPNCSLKRSAQNSSDFSGRFSALGQWISWIHVLMTI